MCFRVGTSIATEFCFFIHVAFSGTTAWAVSGLGSNVRQSCDLVAYRCGWVADFLFPMASTWCFSGMFPDARGGGSRLGGPHNNTRVALPSIDQPLEDRTRTNIKPNRPATRDRPAYDSAVWSHEGKPLPSRGGILPDTLRGKGESETRDLGSRRSKRLQHADPVNNPLSRTNFTKTYVPGEERPKSRWVRLRVLVRQHEIPKIRSYWSF
jgi:hypothetical protein